MWLLISGVLILLVASVLHSYCAIGVKTSPVIAPAIFYSRAGLILQVGWIVGIVAIPVYWLVLPILITPSMKKFMLGSWDDKHILEKRGYTKYNYLSGDWWKRDEMKQD